MASLSQLNAESYTGYNGSHVWSAIYDENCLMRTGSEDNICLEERVISPHLPHLPTSPLTASDCLEVTW